jgi:hypothetical protein
MNHDRPHLRPHAFQQEEWIEIAGARGIFMSERKGMPHHIGEAP